MPVLAAGVRFGRSLQCWNNAPVRESLWSRVVVWTIAGFLAIATLVWSSGGDMLIGLVLVLVLAGWSVLGLYGITSFVRAARTRLPHWLRDWASVWLGCLAALVASVGIAATGVPEDLRIAVSRGALIDAGEKVLAGDHPSRAGLYGFSETRLADGCAMLETGTFAIDSFGFAYCPTQSPTGFDALGGGLFKYYLG